MIVPILLVVLFVVVLGTGIFLEFNNILNGITSFVAFGISLYNLYIGNFKKIHDIRCTLLTAGYDNDVLNAYFTFENIGTEKEVIIGASFVFPDKDNPKIYSTLANSNSSVFMPTYMDPFILNSRDIEIKHFVWKVSYDRLLEHFRKKKEDKFEVLVNIKIDFVDPNDRGKANNIFNFVQLTNLPSGKLDVCVMYTGQYELFKGYKHNIV